jgi:hypothetical protein
VTLRNVRLHRWCAAIAWIAWAASVGLLWREHCTAVLHPAVLPFLLLLAATVLAALTGMAWCAWWLIYGPRRRGAAAWGLICLLPLAFWGALSFRALRMVERAEGFRGDFFSNIARMAAATLMEGEARRAYPFWLESPRLVMFYDERIREAQRDLEAMDRYVASLEELTGKPLREKIHWVRGGIFGREKLAIRGIALGSSQSPTNWNSADHPWKLSLDRHELAHAVVHQLQPPGSNPPSLLIEGWAESHAGMTPQKLGELAMHSRGVWLKSGADPSKSRLGELAGPDWYYRVGGAIYSVGAAFAAHVIRHYGIERFLNLYFACRPGRFEQECEAQLGVKFEALESAFWTEAERLAQGHPP